MRSRCRRVRGSRPEGSLGLWKNGWCSRVLLEGEGGGPDAEGINWRGIKRADRIKTLTHSIRVGHHGPSVERARRQ